MEAAAASRVTGGPPTRPERSGRTAWVFDSIPFAARSRNRWLTRQSRRVVRPTAPTRRGWSRPDAPGRSRDHDQPAEPCLAAAAMFPRSAPPRPPQPPAQGRAGRRIACAHNRCRDPASPRPAPCSPCHRPVRAYGPAWRLRGRREFLHHGRCSEWRGMAKKAKYTRISAERPAPAVDQSDERHGEKSRTGSPGPA